MKTMKTTKRFKCKTCGYLSPAGYKVIACDCPWCKKLMTPGTYKQFKNYCELIEEG